MGSLTDTEAFDEFDPAAPLDLLEPVRPIRALLRGLDALRALNERDGLTVTEVADKARLPRTTAYRILETLRQGGFVIRDDMDDRYRPTLRVRGLADGAENEAWIHEGAWPIISRVGKTALWPMGVWTLEGDQAVLRAATDRTSPVALVRHAAGQKAPAFASPIGHLLLAFLSPDEAQGLARARGAEAALAALEPKLESLRADGHLFDTRVVDGEVMLATPIVRADGAVAGAASVRFIRSALNDQRALGELLPVLQATAREIGEAIARYARPGGPGRSAPTDAGRDFHA